MIKINKLLKKHRNDWARVIDEARELEGRGALSDSILIYEAFLKVQPGNVGALEALATAFLKADALAKSLAIFKKAIKAGASQAATFLNKGIVEARLGHSAEAFTSFEQALRIKPEYPMAQNNLGKLYGDTGQEEKALLCYDAALELSPDYLDAWLNKGVTLRGLERFDQALECFDRALQLDEHSVKPRINRVVTLQSMGSIDDQDALSQLKAACDLAPQSEDAWNALGNQLRNMAKMEEALAAFDRAIEVAPHFAPAHANRASVLSDLRKYDQALLSFERALHLDPQLAEVYSNRVPSLLKLGLLQEALESAETATTFRPHLAEAHSMRAVALMNLNQTDAVLESFSKAIECNPSLADIFINRALFFKRMGQFDKALEDARHSIELKPTKPDAYNNLALIYEDVLEFDKALSTFDEAIQLDATFADAHFNRALLQLLRGNFLEGWRGYEWRWKSGLQKYARDFERPLWLGEESLEGKTILIPSEQGLGDFIQFARYLPALAAKAREVIVEVPEALLSVLKTLDGNYRWIARNKPLPATDFYCPLMTLPLAFKTEVNSIPSEVPYLQVPPDQAEDWRSQLPPKTRPRIGLVWSGSTAHENDAMRSISFTTLKPLLEADYEFHVLQKEFRESDLSELMDLESVHVHSDALKDFGDTAALISEMDLVISVDTSVAHLAGALGRPTWILVSQVPDFRWMLERADSPWYPTARLFRQEARGDWAKLIDRVKLALGEFLPQVS